MKENRKKKNINNTKSWLFEKKKFAKLYTDSSREMTKNYKDKTLPQKPQKFKDSEDYYIQ